MFRESWSISRTTWYTVSGQLQQLCIPVIFSRITSNQNKLFSPTIFSFEQNNVIHSNPPIKGQVSVMGSIQQNIFSLCLNIFSCFRFVDGPCDHKMLSIRVVGVLHTVHTMSSYLDHLKLYSGKPFFMSEMDSSMSLYLHDH